MEDVFVGSEALATGRLTRGQLRWNYRSIFPGVYIRKEVSPSLLHRIYGAWLWSGRRAVIAGLSASALHCDRCGEEAESVELIWHCGGLPATTPERTALAHATDLSADAVLPLIDRYRGTRDLLRSKRRSR